MKPLIEGDFVTRELTRTDFDFLHTGLAPTCQEYVRCSYNRVTCHGCICSFNELVKLPKLRIFRPHGLQTLSEHCMKWTNGNPAVSTISADTTPKQYFRFNGLNRFSEEEWPCFPGLLPNLTLKEMWYITYNNQWHSNQTTILSFPKTTSSLHNVHYRCVYFYFIKSEGSFRCNSSSLLIKSYLFCFILESAVVRSEMEVVLRCENVCSSRRILNRCWFHNASCGLDLISRLVSQITNYETRDDNNTRFRNSVPWAVCSFVGLRPVERIFCKALTSSWPFVFKGNTKAYLLKISIQVSEYL